MEKKPVVNVCPECGGNLLAVCNVIVEYGIVQEQGWQSWDRYEVFDDTSSLSHVRCRSCEREFHGFELNDGGELIGLSEKGATKWSPELPKEEGMFWFFGRRSQYATKDEMLLVEVWRSRDLLLYVASGSFLHEEEGAKGMWRKAVIPAPPEVDGTPQASEG